MKQGRSNTSGRMVGYLAADIDQSMPEGAASHANIGPGKKHSAVIAPEPE